MKRFFLLSFFLISACSSNNIDNVENSKPLFSKSMNFEEFKIKVKNYANQSSFPNIKD
tara:strand:+ start:392 stop:565 length:174 start_codon:yes stop_codon:yes gene_type:complete